MRLRTHRFFRCEFINYVITHMSHIFYLESHISIIVSDHLEAPPLPPFKACLHVSLSLLYQKSIKRKEVALKKLKKKISEYKIEETEGKSHFTRNVDALIYRVSIFFLFCHISVLIIA